MKHYLPTIIIITFLSCIEHHKKDNDDFFAQDLSHFVEYQRNLSEKVIEVWPIKDIHTDSIPGVSLSRAYSELLKDKKGAVDITVALIDMPLKISHPDIAEHLWVNQDEIPSNNMDDDNNGYTDDVNGWNFLGNPKGDNVIFMNYEYTRFKRAFQERQITTPITNIIEEDSIFYKDYERALTDYNKRMDYALLQIERADSIESEFFDVRNTLKQYASLDDITMSALDSVKLKYKEDINLISAIEKYGNFISREMDSTWISLNKLKAHERKNILLNIDYNDRQVQGDDETDLDDNNYGNNRLDHNLNLLNHGTLMAGVITSNFGDQNLDNLTKRIKIMPLCVSGLGDENDKDIALAIKYAVDNGARIINISSGKYFSLRQDWVHDAIKYAEEHNVLIVSSSGNNGLDLDRDDVFKYPNDIDNKRNEISDNFIRAGASNYILDSTIVHPATNYGKKQVDIFAPGEYIYTTSAQYGDYRYTSGTSGAAAIVSKIAAIILSYYPNLTVSDLKHIILNTGIEYDITVTKKDSKEGARKVPFEQLSKSGKVVNLYNALKLAEKSSKQKSFY